ncbi:MAG TPA: hypothetical protein VLT35_00020 [Methanocella sp.]|nr:hypothetical protein [Methanocella sp.]
MADINELAALTLLVAAAVCVAVQYRLLRLSDSFLFAYYLIMSAAIAVPFVALALAPSLPVAQAAADVGILLAGAMAFAAAGWLSFASGVAGDAGDR